MKKVFSLFIPAPTRLLRSNPEKSLNVAQIVLAYGIHVSDGHNRIAGMCHRPQDVDAVFNIGFLEGVGKDMRRSGGFEDTGGGGG